MMMTMMERTTSSRLALSNLDPFNSVANNYTYDATMINCNRSRQEQNCTASDIQAIQTCKQKYLH